MGVPRTAASTVPFRLPQGEIGVADAIPGLVFYYFDG